MTMQVTDSLKPAKGVLFGCTIGALMWAAMIAAVMSSCGCTSAQIWGPDEYFHPVDPVGGVDDYDSPFGRSNVSANVKEAK